MMREAVCFLRSKLFELRSVHLDTLKVKSVLMLKASKGPIDFEANFVIRHSKGVKLALSIEREREK